jgi:translocation and assembly module TamA
MPKVCFIINWMKILIRILVTALLALSIAVALADDKNKVDAPLDVKITGLAAGPALDNVEAEVTVLTKSLKPPFRKAEMHGFYYELWQRIPDAMKPFGYVSAKVAATKEQVGHRWLMQYNITPGPIVKVVKVDIEITGPGKNEKHFQHLKQSFPVKVGQDLNIPKYNKAKNVFYNIASLYGFFNASLEESKIIINMDQHTATFIFKFKTGDRSRFGPTTFNRSPFNDAFLHRYLQYKEGDYYNADALEKTQDALSSSNYFQSLEVDPDRSKQKDKVVPINVQLITRKKRAYFAGAGYGTDTGIRGTLGMDWHWLNQYGHYLKTMIRGSMTNNEFVTTYFIPGRHPATDYYTVEATAGNMDTYSGKSKIHKFSLGYNNQLTEYWKQRVTLNALDEDYDLEAYAPVQASLIYPSIQWIFIDKDKEKNPDAGISLNISLSGTIDKLSTTSGFAQVKVDSRFLYTVKPISTRFVFHGEWGRTQISDIQHLPFSLQLFAGGARSVRGYDYQELGPGKNLIVASAEVQKKIYGPVYLTAFYDMGNVANGESVYKNLQVGMGPGIMVLSPLGSIELSAARAVTKHNQPWSFQFSMGPSL